MWAGSWKGLNTIGANGVTGKTYTLDDGLPGQSVVSLQPHENELYIGSSGGLMKINSENQLEKVQLKDLQEGNGKLAVYDMMEDSKGRLWFNVSLSIVLFPTGSPN